ncbi:MAG: hypothetical protein JSW72_00230, partial [Candidatus Bathyarchaeota archaeon]
LDFTLIDEKTFHDKGAEITSAKVGLVKCTTTKNSFPSFCNQIFKSALSGGNYKVGRSNGRSILIRETSRTT